LFSPARGEKNLKDAPLTLALSPPWEREEDEKI
jgi:hypothetical protein